MHRDPRRLALRLPAPAASNTTRSTGAPSSRSACMRSPRYRMAEALKLEFLDPIPQIFLGLALAAWLATFLGLLRGLQRTLSRGAASPASRRGDEVLGPAKLIELEQARTLVLRQCEPLPAGRVALRAALGMVLAEDVAGAEPVPGFDSSAMDGFAVAPPTPAAPRRGPPVALALRRRVARRSRRRRARWAPARRSRSRPGRWSRPAPTRWSASRTPPATGTGCWSKPRSSRGATSAAPARTSRRERPSSTAGDPDRPGRARRPRLARPRRRSSATAAPASTSSPAATSCSNRARRCGRAASATRTRTPLAALAETAGAEVCGEGRVADDAGETRAAIEAALGADVVVICGGVSVGRARPRQGARSPSSGSRRASGASR